MVDSLYNTCIGAATYVVKNPITQAVYNTAKSVGSAALPAPAPAFELPKKLQQLAVDQIIYKGSSYVRLAGVSGTLAVVLGAYGAHKLLPSDISVERKQVFEVCNRYHFYHSLALFATPLSSHPLLTTSLMFAGMVLFCGTCYYDAFTGKKCLRRLTPIGGLFLITGWLSLVF